MTMTATFTAAQLARGLHRDKPAVLLALRAVPAVPVQTRGGEAKAWPIQALPAAWQQQLAIEARRQGCHDAEHLLQSSAEPWQPRNPDGKTVPLSQIAQPWIDKAGKLRDALREPLTRQHELPRPELHEFGLKEYASAFGYSVTGRHWHRLFDRTVERDRGAENWQRLEIYLDEPAFAQHAPKPSRDKARLSHHELDPIVEALSNKAHPTADDRAWLLHESFTHYERLVASTPSPRLLVPSSKFRVPSPNNPEPGTRNPELQRRERAGVRGQPSPSPSSGERAGVRGQPQQVRLIKSTLLEYLNSAVPALSRTASALRRVFDLKLAQWIEGGRTIDALEDKRPRESGNHRRPAFADDWKKIRDGAILLDGNERLARQMLHDRGELSPEFCAYYPYDPRANKSALPRAGSDIITPAVEFALPLRRSERAFKLAGPWTDRDWSGEKPGDWFNADDVTWNHLFKVRKTDGSWDVLRGECLVMTDAKSDYPVALQLIAGHYNSEHVVCLILRAHDTAGLPRKGMILERGVWNGALVKAVGAGPVPFGETIKAFAQAMPGLEIRRSYTPRSKPIEGVFHHLQDRMRCIFGFVGFNEQVEKREGIQKLIARARRGDKEALSQFLTQDQWADKIVSVFDDFRHSPQNGKRLQGQSPAEAWNESMHAAALPKLSDDMRYILATHCVEAKINSEGIVITIRGHRRCYANEYTGQWLARGEDRVYARYNVEQPDLLTVSDLKQQQFFTVKALSLPAMSATREQLTEVADAKRAHLAPARAIFGDIKHEVLSTITRDDAHDEPAKELGRFHNAAVEQHKSEQSAEDRKLRKIQREAKAIGASVNGHVQNPDRVLDGIEWEKEIRAELEAQRQAKPQGESIGSAGILPAAPPNGKKTYTLNSAVAATLKHDYLNYLIDRLTEFRQAGANCGQKFSGKVTSAATAKIVANTLGAGIGELAVARFEQAIEYLHGKIDATILGKRNHANGVRNYHSFEEHGRPCTSTKGEHDS